MKNESSGAGGPLAERLASLPSDFGGFGEIYDREIQPALAAKEVERKAAWQKAKKFGVLSVLTGIGAAGLGVFLVKSGFAAIPGVLIAIGGAFWSFADLRKVMGHAKQLMIQPVAKRFGITYTEKPGASAEADLNLLRGLGVVPSWDRHSLQDEMCGERNGAPFRFFEAHLEDRRTTTDSNGRSRTTWVTVFRGQCWVFKAPKTFHGTTKVSRDSGIFNALGGVGSNVSRVKLEDPVFEKTFEVYGTDQVEARFLLTPDVMQALVDLETAFKGGKLRCAFDSNQIYVAVEGGDLFEPGSMFKSFDDPERVGDLLEDFAAMFHLIDGLNKKQANP